MPESRPRVPMRAPRAAMFAAVCVALAAVGHAHMSGTGIPPGLLLGAFAVTAALAWTAAGRRRGPLGITAALLAVQAGLHLAFSAGQGHGSAPMADHHPVPGVPMGTGPSGTHPAVGGGTTPASGAADGARAARAAGPHDPAVMAHPAGPAASGTGPPHSGMPHASGMADGLGSATGMPPASGMADGLGSATGMADASGMADGLGSATGMADASGMADGLGSATGMADAGMVHASGMADGLGSATGMADAGMVHASGMADGLGSAAGTAHSGMAHSGMVHASGVADGLGSVTGMADGTGSMSAMPDGIGGALADLLGTAGHGGLGMVAAHLLAGLFCALWLARGEAAVFRLAGALGATALLAARPLARVLALLRTRPVPVPGPPAQRPSYERPRRLRGAVHAHTAVRRGPPLRWNTRTTAPRPLPARAV
ncbi:hypothetical protein AB0469_20035 [Streptomyces sp. NPDC093801]|uniref:hypothetical protein n=1 Tax=Streptomyces sp. NPDC093801 TaxID=3155203 RepID=UPI00344BE674